MNFRNLLSILAIASAAAAHAAGFADASRLSEGRWVKIKVTHEGIQQISHEQLRAWGFSDPAQVGVYGYGGTALALDRISAGADDLPPAASMHTADGRLLFYGDADERLDLRNFDATENTMSESGTLWRRNVYDDGGYYFLSDCAGPTQGAPSVAAPETADADAPEYTGHMHADIRDVDRVSPINMGPIFCERTFTESDPYVIDVVLRDCVGSELSTGPARTPTLAYQALAKTGASEGGGNSVTHSVGGDIAPLVLRHTYATPPRYSTDDYLQMNGSISLRNSMEAPIGDMTGTAMIARPASASAYTYYMDRYALAYPRLNRLRSGEAQLVMHYPQSQAGRTVRVAEASASTRLWDVSDPAAVRELELRSEPDGSAVATMPETFTARRPGRFVLFDTAAGHFEPELIGEVDAQNIHSAKTPVLAIITTAACEPYARMLAEAHERVDGISTAVFLNEQVLNEFACGASTPMAYRRMARMFYERDPETFRYVLLIGSSSWDARGVTRTNTGEQLAIYECNVPSARMNTNTCYASDAYVGCLEDFSYTEAHLARMNVAVGRITARTEAETASMVQHTIDYIENPPAASAFPRALMVSAAGDMYEHFNFCEAMVAELENADRGFVVSRLPLMGYTPHNDLYVDAKRHFKNHLGEGRGLLTYFGHSIAGNTLNHGFYSCADVDLMDYEVSPLSLLATCNAFSIDKPEMTLATSMVAKRGGGAIGVMAATRSVFSDYNRHFGVAVARAYAAARPGDTTGDIHMRAHNSIVMPGAASGLCYNTKCYNLCGDPAVRLNIAEAYVLTDKAEGADGGAARGLAPLLLSGHIENAEGETDSTFDGTADIVVYDTPGKGTIVITDPKATTTPEIKIENVRLATATVNVAAGRWEAEIFLPEFSAPGKTFAIAVDARDAQGRSAHGYVRDLPTESATASTDGLDTTAPEITEMYIDSPDFCDGGMTGADITVYARIAVPATGININAAPLTGASRITLDAADTRSNISGYMQPDGEGFMLLAMPYSGLSEGRHTVSLTTANNVGATAERTLGFTVSASASTASLAVEERPARTEATFSLNHSLGSDADAMLVVDDNTGRTVRVQPYTGSWDLKDNEGADVADGVYSAYVLLRSGLRRTHTPATEVIVVRK